MTPNRCSSHGPDLQSKEKKNEERHRQSQPTRQTENKTDETYIITLARRMRYIYAKER